MNPYVNRSIESAVVLCSNQNEASASVVIAEPTFSSVTNVVNIEPLSLYSTIVGD